MRKEYGSSGLEQTSEDKKDAQDSRALVKFIRQAKTPRLKPYERACLKNYFI